MSYIIDSTNPFISIKLTEKGREKLAKGELNFAFWGIGDSEINYEQVVEDTNAAPILKPKDRQPNIKYFITKTDDTTILNPLTSANKKAVKAIINNACETRGFFSGATTTGSTIYNNSAYTKTSGNVTTNLFDGTDTVDIGTANYVIGDIILFAFTNDTLGTLTADSFVEPIPYLIYKIQNSGTSATTIQVDRNLPNLTGQTGTTTTQFFILPGGDDPITTFYGSNSTLPYWDCNTLSFQGDCDISVDDVKVWNMNNVWCESLAGIQTEELHEDYTYYGSYKYLGQKYPFLEYGCSSLATEVDNCDLTNSSKPDDVNKSISIIHYTNNTISNFYGEFFFIDDANSKLTRIHIPNILWHRRAFTGSGTGNVGGMSFCSASGDPKTIEGTNIKYYDLIEDPTMTIDPANPLVVGRVYHELKIIVLHNDELVMATSYKGNRNWTLPALKAELVAPGSGVGVLDPTKHMYLTYILTNESGDGITSGIHCQNYIKIANNTSGVKDVSFKIEDLDLLPYMRKKEAVGYDGRGFYATNFKLLYQIVDNETDRPNPALWKVVDYTSTSLTSNAGETIDPTALENQNYVANGFLLNYSASTGTTVYNLENVINIPLTSEPDLLQFGDERLFLGNIETYIGATIFKSIFSISVDGRLYNLSNNPTWVDTTVNVRLSEVGIYDDNQELVIIGKLSKAMTLTNNTIMLELSLDF